MPYLVGPSHYVYYGSLYRQRIWLEHLSEAFQPHAGNGWQNAKSHLDSNYRHMAAKLCGGSRLGDTHLGLQKPLSLHQVIDDTPIDSFLADLTEKLDAYEHSLFSLMENHATSEGWLKDLEQTSMLWGRELAQEYLLSPQLSLKRVFEKTRSVRGLFEIIQFVLQGGDFSWKPLLLRRGTDLDLEYELRRCAHRKRLETGATSASDIYAARACGLEAMVYHGFVHALRPDIHYERHSQGACCLDKLKV